MFNHLWRRKPVGVIAFEPIKVGRMGQVVPLDEFFDQIIIPRNAQRSKGIAHRALYLSALFSCQ